MIIEIPDDNSIVKWRYKDNEDWKSAEISDLIKALRERPKGEWLCPNCYLYEQTKDDYCQYAGECTINCRKCKYFKQKGDADMRGEEE